MRTPTLSRWFVAYTLALLIVAPACQIARALAPRRAPADPTAPYRAAVDRLVDASLPPGWTARRGLYTTEIAGPDGALRGSTHFTLSGGGRPILVATRPGGAAPALSSWDPADASAAAGLRAWLASLGPAPPLGGE